MDPRAEIHTILPDLDDLVLAAGTTCAVLITGRPEEAFDIARRIAGQAGLQGRVRVCDFEAGGLDGEGLPEMPGYGDVLLLREIQAMTPAQQVWLAKVLEAADPGRTPRIIASSSVSLFDRVKQGLFDARLFYRLNVLHLVVSNVEISDL